MGMHFRMRFLTLLLMCMSLVMCIRQERQEAIFTNSYENYGDVKAVNDDDKIPLISDRSKPMKNKLQDTLIEDLTRSKPVNLQEELQLWKLLTQKQVEEKKKTEEEEEEEEDSEEIEEEEEDKETNETTVAADSNDNAEKQEESKTQDQEEDQEEESEEQQDSQNEEKDENPNETSNEKPKVQNNSTTDKDTGKNETSSQKKLVGGKQHVFELKGGNQLIQTEDGEVYLVRKDNDGGNSQILNMNKIKEVDFKNSRLQVEAGLNLLHGDSTSAPAIEKYSMPSYEPFEWSRVISDGNQPHSRQGHSFHVSGNQIILFAGCYLDLKCYNDLYFFDIMEMTWVEPKVLGEPPSPRGGHSSTLVGSYLYIFGGSSEEGLLSDLHRLNLENRIWEQLNFEGEKPAARTNHKAVLDNSGRVVIFGGYTAQGYSNDVFFLDLVNMRWTKPHISGELPKSRENFGMVLIRSSFIWMFGGYGGVELNDLWELDVEEMKWVRLLQSFGTKPSPRQGHNIVLHGKLIYVFAGCSYQQEACFNDIYSLDIKDLTWNKIDFALENPLEERENFGVGVMGSEIYLFGGCKMMGKCFDDFRVMNVTDACPNNCTGRGTCRNNRCNCNDGFSGEQCELEMKCEYNCSNRGICGSNGHCLCYHGFAGRICEMYVPCPSNCTSAENGYCLPNGQCNCLEGYSGPSCEVGKKGLISIDVKCLNECSHKGECNQDTGICICEEGYGDVDCSLSGEELKLKLEEKEKEKLAQGNDENVTNGVSSTANTTATSATANSLPTIPTNATKPISEDGHSIPAESLETVNNLTSSTLDDSTTIPAVVTDTTNNSSSNTVSDKIAEFLHTRIKMSTSEDVLENLEDCENSCSYKGICVDGSCFCNPGITGEDCSAEKISELHKGQKAIRLIFYVPLFFIAGIVLGYMYAKRLQVKQEEKEFGDILDYEERSSQTLVQVLNQRNGAGTQSNKKFVEDGSDTDSLLNQSSNNQSIQEDSQDSGSAHSQEQNKLPRKKADKLNKNEHQKMNESGNENHQPEAEDDKQYNIFARDSKQIMNKESGGGLQDNNNNNNNTQPEDD